jgi:hypothetical protein
MMHDYYSLDVDDNMFSGTIPSPPIAREFRTAYLDGSNRWVGGVPSNMTFSDLTVKDVNQTTRWPFLASGASCKEPPVLVRRLGGEATSGRRLVQQRELCTAGDRMCSTNNKVCCARIGKDQQQCPTGYCAPTGSANAGRCGRSCKRGGGDGTCPAANDEGVECARDRCVQGGGWCDGDFGDYGTFEVCCGANGIDDRCITERANALPNIYHNNWCMRCTGVGSMGLALTGCSAPEPPATNGTLIPGVKYVRCRLDAGSDSNVVQMSDSTLVTDTSLKYLALSGSEVVVPPEKLALLFENLIHLELTDTNVGGLLLSSNVVDTWSQLEYLNVSTSSNLCRVNCFHGDLSTMSNLQVLDISHVDFSNTTEFAKIGQLTGLKELYVNNNPLTSLPPNLFDGLTSLTKLRIAGTDISVPLPEFLYDRAGFDCDVERGASPHGRSTLAPTSSAPTSPLPTTAPTTATPTKSPSTSAPTKSPSTSAPTSAPTNLPPTSAPTSAPTELLPTSAPTHAPTKVTIDGGVASPTNKPTTRPTIGQVSDSTTASLSHVSCVIAVMVAVLGAGSTW